MEESSKKISLSIDELKDGDSIKIVRNGENYIATPSVEFSDDYKVNNNVVEQATYNFKTVTNHYGKDINEDSGSYIVTPEQLSNLAKNSQTDVDKIDKINGIIRYYINKDDLIGRVVETIENNVNTNYSYSFPKEITVSTKRKEKKMLEELDDLIRNFNEQIDIRQLVRDTVLSTYIEGNYIITLLGKNIEEGYSVANYPLKIAEITPLKVDNEPIVSIDVNTLKNKLNQIKNKYSKIKSNNVIDIDLLVEEEIKRDYPEEVYNAYVMKDKIALLNTKNTGVIRINNLKRKYGLSPIFKALSPQLMLETLDNVDRKNLKAKAKKIIVQLADKELMGKDYSKPMQTNPIGYSHASLVASMQQDTVIYTAMPYINDVKILEPTQDITEPDKIAQYKNRVLSALGIMYLSSEDSIGSNTAKMNYDDLLKTINKIVSQLNPIINKWYKKICIDNGFPVEYAPEIKIESTSLLDTDTLLKIVECYFGKISLSYETIIKSLGLNYQDELRKRKQENEEGISEVFSPYGTSYTTSNEEIKNNSNTNSNGSKKSENEDKSLYDKNREDSQV